MDHQLKKGGCVWINGPKGSGKNQLARMLEASLKDRGMGVECLDEETIEGELGSEAKTPESTDAGPLRAAFAAHLLTRNGVTVIISAPISSQDLGNRLRDRLPRLVEVVVNVRAGAGQKDQAAPTVKPDIVLYPDQDQPREDQLAESLAQLIKFLEISGHLPAGKQDDLTEEESALVKERLKALGYL